MLTLGKIKGQAQLSAMLKKLRGGPMSMLPGSPVKGSGVKSFKGNTPLMTRKYSTPMQNPKVHGGLLGLKTFRKK